MPPTRRIEIRPDGPNRPFIVDPPTAEWNRKSHATLPIKNSTEFDVVCWFPEYETTMLAIAAGGTGMCHESHTSHLGSKTTIEYAVYVKGRRVFAEGKSAPKMILDP